MELGNLLFVVVSAGDMIPLDYGVFPLVHFSLPLKEINFL